MAVPEFLLARLYRRGSLRQVAPNAFEFSLRNVLGEATVIAPPQVEVNGILYAPHQVEVADVDVRRLSPMNPLRFPRGQRLTVRLPGTLLLGGNRIRIVARTKEWGEVVIYAEDRAAESCDLPPMAIEEE